MEGFFAARGLEHEVGFATEDGDEVLVFADDFGFGWSDFRTWFKKAIEEADVEEVDLMFGDAGGGEGVDVEGADFDVFDAAFFDGLDGGFFVVFGWTFRTNAGVVFRFALEEVFVDTGKAFVVGAFGGDRVL